MTAKLPKSLIPLSQSAKEQLDIPRERFDQNGLLVINSRKEARELVMAYTEKLGGQTPSAGTVYAAGYIAAACQILLDEFEKNPQPYEKTLFNLLPDTFVLPESHFQKWILTNLARINPGFSSFANLFQNPGSDNEQFWMQVEEIDRNLDRCAPEDKTPLETLKTPFIVAPYSVRDQLLYILKHWGALLGDWIGELTGALDMMEEENRIRFTGPGPVEGPGVEHLDGAARFSQDDDWMPNVVLLAKNVLVWLSQLTESYGYRISRLDQVPDEELDIIASRGFNTLWLIGLWERSPASREIKQRMGNPHATASAYSLFGYDIAGELGGWAALDNLRHRALQRGIRLSSDMVPNHVGIDSDWVRHHPERLLSVPECPYPSYSFLSDNLSGDEAVDIRLEDHYYNQSDAAVVFQHRNNRTGEVRYLYHGNDGTSIPWNDTAQIDFLNPEAREMVIQDIIRVASNFPVIRFDAAMVLARKHIRRLWFPAPGSGGAISSRSEYALTDDDFNKLLPKEFWREVVDRVAHEAPGTLLLAEAFWMMEGFFVRTLGMHRVYNSAFMNMLRDQKNAEYRNIIKDTLAFDPGILQRFVNFMNNPDEETAVNQFGKDDRYFAVCTLLATLPGLPMIGHGQIEGLSEKYGMEYTRAFRDESRDDELIARHDREIFPLLLRRRLFAGASEFRLYDLHGAHGVVESVYAFTNVSDTDRALIIVNNSYERAIGTIDEASPVNTNECGMKSDSLAAALVPDDTGDDNWILLRDQTANLWYIRSVGELRKNGLQISIDGFGRQTFLDIHIPDGRNDVWETLAADLNGSGVHDLESVLKKIKLRPLYNVLDQLLPPDVIHKMADRIRMGKKPLPWLEKNKIGKLLDQIRAFRGTDFGNSARATEKIQHRLEASAKMWRFPYRSLRRSITRKFGDSSGDDALLLVLWSILSVPGEGCWYEWDLDNWVRRYFECHNLSIAMNLPSWIDFVKSPSQALGILLTDNEGRQACGVNFWDGELWYNQEGWNSFVRTVILTASSQTVSHRTLKQLLKKWSRAADASEFRLNRLLQFLR